MAVPASDRIRLFLRPPGCGVPTFSTGGGHARPLWKRLFGTEDSDGVQSAWKAGLSKLAAADTLLVGMPSDSGAGLLRGAAQGPVGIRTAYLAKYGSYPEGLLDIGDVLCVPQLLHDSMLTEAQKAACRKAFFPKMGQAELPVSPLSLAEDLFATLVELNPNARLVVLGGDHSVTWPAMQYCRRRLGENYGVLHLDAHPDLMEQRLGIDYCFATWAFHAQKQMKPRHLVQVGLRTTRLTREEWEARVPVRQFWAHEIKGNEAETIRGITEHFHDLGVTHIYLTNDIDGTDPRFAPATGAPEEGGLEPEFVKALIRATRRQFQVFGGDITEVAPPLSGSLDFAEDATCGLAADYLHALIEPIPNPAR